jgi:hypothetical protein
LALSSVSALAAMKAQRAPPVLEPTSTKRSPSRSPTLEAVGGGVVKPWAKDG